MFNEAKVLGEKLMSQGWPLQNYLCCFLNFYLSTGRDAKFRELLACYQEDLNELSSDKASWLQKNE
jgi:hypothetical protein